MAKKLPHSPEMKAVQPHVDRKKSPKKKMEIQAREITASLIERVRQQSLLRK